MATKTYGHRKTRSNEGLLYYNTVQTTWRPHQLPLPKEIIPPDHNSIEMESKNSSKKDSSNKKWSFGKLFRRKKEIDTESSSDEDRKAGFTSTQKPKKKNKKRRGSKITGAGFDHIVICPKENEIFLPLHHYDATGADQQFRSTNSLDRRERRALKKAERLMQFQSSSDEELRSQNSSLPSKYRSDESVYKGSNRKNRSSKQDKYYRRFDIDDISNSSIMQIPQPVADWHHQNDEKLPQNMSNFISSNGPKYLQTSLGSNNTFYTSSSQHLPVPADIRSLSCDNSFQTENRSYHHSKTPPPPPPRDPLRRINISHQELRPSSYAFDTVPLRNVNSRCVSDDKLWGPDGSIYQKSLTQRPSSTQPIMQQKQQQNRLIARSENQNFKYVADAVPRSRKPIHVINQDERQKTLNLSSSAAFVPESSPKIIRTTKSGLPSTPMQSASNFWKRMEQQNSCNNSRGRDMVRGAPKPKPRSMSSSRVEEPRSYYSPMLENLYGNKKYSNQNNFHSEISRDEVDCPIYSNLRNKNFEKTDPGNDLENVVSGQLFIAPSKGRNLVKVYSKYDNKSNSMPNYYHRKSSEIQKDHNENIVNQSMNQEGIKLASDRTMENFRKSTNLDDAINELEEIYKSLKLGDEELLERAERRDIPTPTNFEKYGLRVAKQLSDEEDEDEEQGEPDIIYDDVAYRNITHLNSIPKVIDPQPPFGIPIGPIPPSPKTDYLHVNPEKNSKKNRCVPENIPDVISDDLAVRTLRKDSPGSVIHRFPIQISTPNKKRALRTQSANIYNLIQRDAAKPAGGDLNDYYKFEKGIEKTGSMSDIKRNVVDDIPATLSLIRNLQNQEQNEKQKRSSVFRHPSKGGAVYNLPTILKSETSITVPKPPVPLPRKSVSPCPDRLTNRTKMEEALNQIAKEAKESSEKLSRDLAALRQGIPKNMNNNNLKVGTVEKNIQEIENVSKTAKQFEEILKDIVPNIEPEVQTEIKTTELAEPKRLNKEKELLKDISDVSEAAKVCEKQLQEIVSENNPLEESNDQDPMKNNNCCGTVLASLFEKLDPNSNEISEIATRCMRQLSELSDLTDEPISSVQTTDNENSNSNLKESATEMICKNNETSSGENVTISTSSVVPGKNDESLSNIQDQIKTKENNNTSKYENDELVSGSSSDCMKSTSPSIDARRQPSSSITSINVYSSSDCIKSSASSQSNNPFNSDPVKTLSTTSCEVKSSSETQPPSTSPSPLFDLSRSVSCTPATAAGNASDYNSSDELAMIFGIDQTEKTSTKTTIDSNDNITHKLSSSNAGKTLACDRQENFPLFVRNANNTTLTAIIRNHSSLIDCSDLNLTPSLSSSPLLIEHESEYKNVAANSITITEKSNQFDKSFESLDDSTDKNPCMLTTSDYFGSVFNYSNNISIIINDENDNENSINELTPNLSEFTEHFDSIRSKDESNPDSGNVSLNEFPVQYLINTSLELSLVHNCCNLEIVSPSFNSSSFINQIDILTTSSPTPSLAGDEEISKTIELNDVDNSNSSETVVNYNNSIECTTKINDYKDDPEEENRDDDDDEENEDDVTTISDCLSENISKSEVLIIQANEDAQSSQKNVNDNPGSTTTTTTFNDDYNQLQPTATMINSNLKSTMPLSSACIALIPERHRMLIQHALLACTYSILNNEFCTFLAIILALITLIATLLF